MAHRDSRLLFSLYLLCSAMSMPPWRFDSINSHPPVLQCRKGEIPVVECIHSRQIDAAAGGRSSLAWVIKETQPQYAMLALAFIHSDAFLLMGPVSNPKNSLPSSFQLFLHTLSHRSSVGLWSSMLRSQQSRREQNNRRYDTSALHLPHPHWTC